MPRPSPAPRERLERVLAAADVSGRTLRRYLAGESMRRSSIRRLEHAMEAEGLEDLIARRAARLRAQDTATPQADHAAA